jgi:hypothetical protein
MLPLLRHLLMSSKRIDQPQQGQTRKETNNDEMNITRAKQLTGLYYDESR